MMPLTVQTICAAVGGTVLQSLSLIHISEPTRRS